MADSTHFAEATPVSVPRQYASKRNAEISAFVTSWLMFGDNALDLKLAQYVDFHIFRGMPLFYILGEDIDQRREWERCAGHKAAAPAFREWTAMLGSDEPLCEGVENGYTEGDFAQVCGVLFNVYTVHDSLEDALLDICAASDCDLLGALDSLFGHISGMPDVANTAAAKYVRFLRWMMRKDSPVDLGLWDRCRTIMGGPAVEVDRFTLEAARQAGLTERTRCDAVAVEEITAAFAKVFPGDEARGYYSLVGLAGMAMPVKPRIDVKQASILDVLQSGEYFTALADLMAETARKKAILINGQNIPALRWMRQISTAAEWSPACVRVLVAEILDKRCTRLSSTCREFVRLLGVEAFNKTMIALGAAEAQKGGGDENNI